MKRRSWWMALFAPSAAAQTVITQGVPMPSPPSITWRDGQWIIDGKPMQGGGAPPKGINNHCPVCGTVAAPYIRDVSGMTGCAPAQCDLNGGCFAVCRAWSVDDLPKSQEIRCAHCNVSFWQDAEANQ